MALSRTTREYAAIGAPVVLVPLLSALSVGLVAAIVMAWSEPSRTTPDARQGVECETPAADGTFDEQSLRQARQTLQAVWM